MKDKVVVVVGPTASGKSSLAIDIAEKKNGEVVSADSMQIYRGMDIGTAKVSDTRGVKHYLIDIVEPSETFTLSDFLLEANKAVRHILSKGKLPVIAGGTGLYVSSFMDNISLSEVRIDENYRRQLRDFAAKNGNKKLHELLKDIDPESYKILHPNDEKRIIRALEMVHLSGITVSEQNKISKLIPSPYDFYVIGLNFKDRSVLYDRINKRVDDMIAAGFIDEVASLDFESLSQTARQAIGYKQIFEYIKGTLTLQEAVESIKTESRRYAKRQLTWFRRDSRVNWIYVDELDCEPTCELFETSMEKFLEV